MKTKKTILMILLLIYLLAGSAAMGYPWELSGGTYPIAAGTEINWKHFETMRRRIYLCRFPSAGAIQYDYESPTTSETWEQWVDDNFSPGDFAEGGMDYTKAGWIRLLNIVYQGTADPNSTDLFSVYTDYKFPDANDLKANPPISTEGVLNGKWCYAVDVSKYHHLDTCSGRRIVKRYTAATGITFLSAKDGYEYLPMQTGPNDQERYIKYLDTERIIPRRKHLELDRRILTYPATLGPNYALIYITVSGYFAEARQPLAEGEAKNLGLAGMQDGLPSPWADPGEGVFPGTMEPEENQLFFDPKLCGSYQNQAESVIASGRWMIKIDPNTPWGKDWIENYNQKKYHLVPTWPQYEYMSPDDTEWYYTKTTGGKVWRKSTEPDPETESPSHSAGWQRTDYGNAFIAYEPTYDEAVGENWGCNRSAVELALWMADSYDWYIETGMPSVIRDVSKMRWDMEQGYYTQEEIDASYPLAAASIRRTHYYTFGRPKGDGTMMSPKNKQPDEIGLDFLYTDYQGPLANMKIWWPGYFIPEGEVPESEEDYLTESQREALAYRHDPKIKDTAQHYEILRTMLNDLWLLLDICDLRYSDISAVLGMRNGQGGQIRGSQSAAWTAARDEALENLANDNFEISPAYAAGHKSSVNPYQNEWFAQIAMSELEIYITAYGDIPFNELRAKQLGVFLRLIPVISDTAGGYPSPEHPEELYKVHPYDIAIGLEDFEVDVPNFQTDYYRGIRPSTGQKDTPPDTWWYWGGRDPDSLYYWNPGISGRIFLVKLNLADGEYDEELEQWTFRIVADEFLPVNFSDNELKHYIISQVDVELLSQNGVGVHMDPDADGVDWDTLGHIYYTEIEIDDKKFDNDGRLK